MAKIVAKSRYQNEPRGLSFAAGEVFDADESLFVFLFQDSPDSFELWNPAPVVDAPPVDKAVSRKKVVRK